MAWARGDVVLIPFPYSDLSAAKARPSVVVNSPAYQIAHHELLLAYLTSQISQSNPTFDYLLADWQSAGLLKPSLMKPRVVVIRETLVQHRVGTLSLRDLIEVDRRLIRAMSLNTTALDDALAASDLTSFPAESIQRLAEAALSAVVGLAAHGEQAIDLSRLRAQFPSGIDPHVTSSSKTEA